VSTTTAYRAGYEHRSREIMTSLPSDLMIQEPVTLSPRNQTVARRVVKHAYPFRCCIICGLQIETCLTIAHLDHNAGHNAADNLAYLCQTHHWMYDAGLFPIEAIRLFRAHWQETKGVPDHKPRMKTAGSDAARTRRRKAAARKAVETRRRNRVRTGTPN
jgi:hypothetical protein